MPRPPTGAIVRLGGDSGGKLITNVKAPASSMKCVHDREGRVCVSQNWHSKGHRGDTGNER